MMTARTYPDSRCPFCTRTVRLTNRNAFYKHLPLRSDQPMRNGRCFGSDVYAYARKAVR